MHRRFYRPPARRKPLHLGVANRILVVAAPVGPSDEAAVGRFYEKLIAAGQEMTMAITGTESYSEGILGLAEAYSISNDKLTWLGLPEAATQRMLTEGSFDIAVNLAGPDLFPAHYAMAVSHASFRMGFYSSAYAYIYDFMVREPEDGSLAAGIATFEMYMGTVQKQ
jgi:hypothetical protein